MKEVSVLLTLKVEDNATIEEVINDVACNPNSNVIVEVVAVEGSEIQYEDDPSDLCMM